MSGLLPLLVAVPAVTGLAGYVARDLRTAVPSVTGAATAAPPGSIAPATPAPHRPRVEFFNLAELTNTDAKGFVRPVDRFHVEPWGLYMARAVGGPDSHYLESWLLPELSLRATLARTNPAHHRDPVYRLDIGEFTRIAPKRWKAVDQYLDIAVRPGRSAELLGVNELLAAHAAGLVDTVQAHRAFERATAVLDGLATHDHCVEDWLATHGITLTWM
ncbi:DUF402 domain-containing protein [Nocardia gipuzkoensis]|uniref:DUF402 domain-containing protein n=1 Tax=Nocardia gipuzkoensis TaxID=2749991 RepID=UPI00237E2F2C|nr:DUF402 domain-containing protein [Nocardia gipuzkoensis]MDE1671317.1 DUF402 domain-containing protein [Nocardia gipuzkoensis]